MKDNFSKVRSFMAKNAPEKPSIEALKKEAEDLYEKRLQEDARLMKLYNDKKLTNKATIRKARALVEKYNNNNNNK